MAVLDPVRPDLRAPVGSPPVGRPPDEVLPPVGGPGGGLPGSVRPGTRWLLRAFLSLTTLAVLALVLLPGAHHQFAWSIHMELTAAWLGAAYASGSLLSLLALRRNGWHEVRIAVVTVATFTWLTLVATLVHTHKLNLMSGTLPGRLAAWVWLAVYLVVPVACWVLVSRQDRDHVRSRVLHRPMPRSLAGLLGAQGVVLAAAGTVLFLGGLTVHHESEAVTRFWPWDLMPLSSQVIGAWLIALGLGAALVIRDRDLSRLRVPAAAYTAFGVLQLGVLVGHRADVEAGDPWLWAYVAVLAVVVGTGGFGWWAGRDPGVIRRRAG
ncbi:hypothetical protein GCU56_01135 [Geodermatophilus sabuli]|uniref:Uncharacterized protein n=1 Tax=Geodermatophilus sabuli TaxID=1564158 RepID=A0A7K3VV06_9ACTN|nr:hypothetical protein [Geodermatophilus sabuli]NEK56479.1 hypothetical protein [Geodermatophilus sabuli]